MPTSEHLVDTGFAKRLTIVNCLVPAALLLWDAYRRQLGVNDVNFAIRTTGMVGLVLITLSLVITPLRALTGWNRLISIRRNLGVLGFFYIVAHFAIFFLFDRAANVGSTFTEVVTRVYLWFGMGALLLMVPLALTSTDAMILRLGARRWKRLHRLAYPIGVAAVVHYYLLVKSDVRQPLAFAGVVGILLGYRVVAHYVGLRTAARAARDKVALARGEAPRKRFWAGELTIARIFDETHDVKTFRLVPPDGVPLPFEHVAGQYLNLALTIDGRRVNRSYTIASPPTRNAYCEISVRRITGGDASEHLHGTWREGQRVKVSAPAGRFVFAGHEAGRVVFIAGGIGITPMMSVVRSLTDRGWAGGIHLLFSVRSERDIVFREELAYLQARFPNLHVHVVITRDAGTTWQGVRGQITRDVIAGAIPDLRNGPVLLCGPTSMMAAMRRTLVAMGVPDAEILEEAFLSPIRIETDSTSVAAVVEPAMEESSQAGDYGPLTAAASVLFNRAGKTVELREQTILEAAEEAAVDIPFECRSGICGQCKTPLLAGRVTMEVQDALTASDKAKGLILACQARAVRDVTVDA